MELSGPELEQVADALETAAGITLGDNDNAGEGWARIAAAAEELAGATTEANVSEAGYQLRTAIALESLAGTSGAEENVGEGGYLERIADALEALAGDTYDGDVAYRIVQGSQNAVFSSGPPAWVPEGAIGFIDIPNQRAWSEEGGEVALADALSAYTAADITADGLLIDATHNVGTKLDSAFPLTAGVAGNATTMVIDCTPGAFLGGGYHQVLYMANAGAANMRAGIENWNGDLVYIGSPYMYDNNNGAFIPAATRSRYALRIDGTGVTGSVNGRTSVLDAAVPNADVDADNIFLGCDPWYAPSAINGRLRFVEFYPPDTDDAALEVLSLPPFSDAFFAAGRYELDGASVALSDLFVEGDDFLYDHVIADEGLVLTNGEPHAPDGTGAVIKVYATPALAAEAASGFTCVLEYRPNTILTTFDIGPMVGDSTTGAWAALSFSPDHPAYNDILRSTLKSWDGVIEQVEYDTGILPGGAGDVVDDLLFRIAVTFDGADMAISVNGRAAQTMTATNDGAVDGIASGFAILSAADDDIFPHPGYRTTLERARFYAPQDAARLPAFSALH